MPNHVENIIQFSGDRYQINTMLEQIKDDQYGIGTIDFNKIIPMPSSLNIEAGSKTDRGLKIYKGFVEVYTLAGTMNMDKLDSIPIESEQAFLQYRTDVIPEEWELGKIAWNNIRKYNSPTWYDWCICNWGTKWNAYGYEGNAGYTVGDKIEFQTAWSAPHTVLGKLSEMYPEISFEHQWADEDIGMNCGRRTYLGGEMIDEYIPEGIRATDFALKVWDYDPAEFGMAKNSTGTAYINIEDEKYQLIELLGRRMLFTNGRITGQDIPQGLYFCHLRHSDDGGHFCSVEPKVGVNHGGSIIMNEPLDFGKKGYIPLTEHTEPHFLGKNLSIAQYMCGELEQTKTAEQTLGGISL